MFIYVYVYLSVCICMYVCMYISPSLYIYTEDEFGGDTFVAQREVERPFGDVDAGL